MPIDPSLISAGAGLIASLFGPKPKYTEGQKIQLDMARRMRNYATGIPGSDPQERAALAQMRGQLGAEQGQQTNQILGAMPNYARTNTGDMMQNLAGSQAVDRSNLDLSAMMDWLNQRRQAMLGTAQIAGSVGQPTVRENNVPQLMGQLAQLYAQNQAQKAGQGTSGQSQGGSMWPSYQPAGGASAPFFGGGAVAGQSQPLHPAFNPALGMGGPAQSLIPAFGQSVPAMSAGTQSGAAGVLAPASGATAAPPLQPLNLAGLQNPVLGAALGGNTPAPAPFPALGPAGSMVSSAMGSVAPRRRKKVF